MNTMDPTDMRLIIIQRCDSEMAARGITINDENRYHFYQGLADGWTESDRDNPEAGPWIAALVKEIAYLRSQLSPEQLDPEI